MSYWAHVWEATEDHRGPKQPYLGWVHEIVDASGRPILDERAAAVRLRQTLLERDEVIRVVSIEAEQDKERKHLRVRAVVELEDPDRRRMF